MLMHILKWKISHPCFLRVKRYCPTLIKSCKIDRRLLRKYAVPFFGLTLVGVATLSTLALLFNRYCLLHVSIALSNQLPRLFILIHPPFFYIIVIVVSTIESGMHAKHPTFFNAKEMNLHI